MLDSLFVVYYAYNLSGIKVNQIVAYAVQQHIKCSGKLVSGWYKFLKGNEVLLLGAHAYVCTEV